MSLRKSMLPSRGDSEMSPQDMPHADAVAPQPHPTAPAFEGLMSRSSPDIAFRPSEAQSRIKARFWARWGVPAVPTMSDIKKTTNSTSVEVWAKQPGFLDWFLNTHSAEEKVAHLSELGFQALEDVLLNTDPKSQGARIQAVKVVADLAKQFAEMRRAAADSEKDKVKAMSHEELAALLLANGVDMNALLNVSAKPQDK